MLVLVASSASNFKKRKEARTSWAKKEVGFLESTRLSKKSVLLNN